MQLAALIPPPHVRLLRAFASKSVLFNPSVEPQPLPKE
jgi:hypothetical protein